MGSDGEARAMAALAIQARVHPANPLVHPRALVSRASNWRKVKGICPWCNEPSDAQEQGWHYECQRYYYAARGATHFEKDNKRTPLVPQTPCAKCKRAAQQIDHVVSLSTARRIGGAQMLRAWTPRNLQWLCNTCHAGKTARETKTSRTRQLDLF